MDSKSIGALRERLPGGVFPGEPLKEYTTYRVGGEAEALVVPRSREDAAWVFRFATSSGIPLTILGAGSNVIVPDAGIAGIVLVTKSSEARIEFGEGGCVSADAGVPLQDLVDAAAARGRGGLEPLAGIPGTVGGAVVMNAGTRDTETADLLARIEYVTPAGERREVPRSELSFAYRRSEFLGGGSLVLGAEFRLEPADPAAARKRIDAFIADRWSKYPMDLPSAGSVFKRPPGDYPGRLIELAGCKGMRVGGALVSERHANFIVNDGGATAADIVELIDRVRARVRAACGVELELEQIVLSPRRSPSA